jgi:hypothetical protein
LRRFENAVKGLSLHRLGLRSLKAPLLEDEEIEADEKVHQVAHHHPNPVGVDKIDYLTLRN